MRILVKWLFLLGTVSLFAQTTQNVTINGFPNQVVIGNIGFVFGLTVAAPNILTVGPGGCGVSSGTTTFVTTNAQIIINSGTDSGTISIGCNTSGVETAYLGAGLTSTNYSCVTITCVTSAIPSGATITGTVGVGSGKFSISSVVSLPIVTAPGVTGGVSGAGNLVTLNAVDCTVSAGTIGECSPAIVVGGLVANSSGAAAANTTAIQAALTAGGSVHIAGAPGTVYYVNGPLIQGSNTFFWTDPGVILRSNNNTTVWENYAQSQPYIASSGCTWTSGNICSLNFPSHGLAVGSNGGVYVYMQGSMGYLASATYSSGASGCTSGTQSVTLANQAGFSSVVGTVTVSAGVPTGALTLASPNLTWAFGSNINASGTVATCTGTAVFTSVGVGFGDSAYSGIFQVLSVTDANTLVVRLLRVPLASLSGALYVKKADVNLLAQNLTLDFNNGSGTYLNSHTAILAGIENFNYYGTYTALNVSQTGGYPLCVAAVDNFHFSGFTSYNYGLSSTGASGGPQFFGPLTNSTILNTTAFVFDDLLSLQTSTVSNFYYYLPNYFGGGDILHDTVDGISGTTSVHCAVIYGGGNALVDDVTIRNGNCNRPAGVAQPAYAAVQQAGTSAFGTVTFERINCLDDTTNPCIVAAPSSMNFLKLTDITGPQNPTANAITLFATLAGGTGPISNLVVDGVKFYPHNASDIGFNLLSGADYILNVDIGHFYMSPGPGTYAAGTLVLSNNTSGKSIFVHDGVGAGAGSTLGAAVKVTAAGPIVKATNNVWNSASGTVTSAAMLQATAATTFEVGNNTITGGWLFGLTGSNTYPIYSNGGNQFPAGKLIGIPSGSPVADIYGGCSDMLVDVSQTYVGNVANGCVVNTNTSYGPAASMASDGTYWRPLAGGFHATMPSTGGTLLAVGCTNQSTVTVNGAQTGMACSIAGTAGNPANVQPQCSVTAANTVTPQFCASVAVTPAAQTYNITVQ